MEYWLALEYCLAVTVPVFIIIFLGFYLKYRRDIDDSFVSGASTLVFKVCLPILIFLSIVENKVSILAQLPLVLFCMVSAVVCFGLFWRLSKFWVVGSDRGVVVQGAFRSNLGIIGLALCAKGFDQEGLAVGAVILAVVTPVYNVLSVFALNYSQHGQQTVPVVKTLKDIAKNPLIIAIALGFMVAQIDFKMPVVLYDTGSYLAAMTLPLALISIGGSLSMRELKNSSQLSAWTVFAKLVLVPSLVVFPAYFMGFRGVEFGCILLMFASPTATASFVMVRAMGGNYHLASNIIVLSTLFSAVSISLLLYLIKLLALI